MKNVLAISGSLRSGSSNIKIIDYVARRAKEKFYVNFYKGLAALPAFNPDLDREGSAPPAEVAQWRGLIQASDGVLICTPEYVFGVPGALKNALDWTVSSGEFNNKPTALITASSLGEKAHESLLLTLKTLEAEIGPARALLISHVRTKLDASGDISDEQTADQLKALINSFFS